MIEVILNYEGRFIFYLFLSALLFYWTLSYSVNWNELDRTFETCPKCSSYLFVERGSWLNVYRCRDCNFEGAKAKSNLWPIKWFVQGMETRYERLRNYTRGKQQ